MWVLEIELRLSGLRDMQFYQLGFFPSPIPTLVYGCQDWNASLLILMELFSHSPSYMSYSLKLSFELLVFLHQPPKYWNYRCMPYLAGLPIFIVKGAIYIYLQNGCLYLFTIYLILYSSLYIYILITYVYSLNTYVCLDIFGVYRNTKLVFIYLFWSLNPGPHVC